MVPFLDKLKIFDNLKGKFSKEKISVGLDIGTSSIKIVKLKLNNDTAELCDFKQIPVSFGLDAALKELAQTEDIKDVNISVSGHSTIIRYVNFPKMNPEELTQALKFEAQKLIPFAINEINLDNYILKPDLPDNKMLLLLAAVKIEFINQRLKLLETAGIRANIVDIDSLALVNAFNFNHSKENDELKNKTVAVLNIGASISNLNLLENFLPCLSRDIKTAGNHFTKKIIDALSVDLPTAEDLKINPDKDKSSKIPGVFEQVITNLATEVRTSFDYYESQCPSTVSKIYISGGGSLLKGLKESLSSMLDIEVAYWDSFSNIDISNTSNSEKLSSIKNNADLNAGAAGINEAQALSALLPVAVGLALRQ